MPPSLTSLKKVGDTYQDFQVTRYTPIEEIQATLLEIQHLPTGAIILNVANDDPENTFCLCLQTTPDTSNGVAHILEHTVLCGSKKFPVHDPFFAMTRRSLNTFMNAFTGQDFTCYPASSQVRQDFYNLLSVYCDAVFHPHLNEMAFLQEGHRLEFALPTDPTSELVHKGIVFNEMKGCLTSPGRRFWEVMGEALFPDVTYGQNSGGSPQEIPKLTHEELKAFHQTYYDPARCLYFFAGNLPIEEHLSWLQEHVFQGVSRPQPLPPLAPQPRFSAPQYKKTLYPIAEEASKRDKTWLGIGWLSCPSTHQDEALALSVLQSILTETDASPLKKALLQSGLCKEVYLSMLEDIHEIPLILSIRGCNEEDVPALEELVEETLRHLALQGFSKESVESALHQIEFERLEINGDHYPYGLGLFFRCGLIRQHGGLPEEGLKIHSSFEKLRKKLQEPRYLEKLLEKYLIINPHKVVVTMEPSHSIAQEEAEAEKRQLAQIKEELTAEQSQEILDKTRFLKTYQAAQENQDMSCLPDMDLLAVPQTPQDFPLQEEHMGGSRLLHHATFTNQISYLDLCFDLPNLALEQQPYVQLLSYLTGQMGAAGKDYTTTLNLIQEHTGGILSDLSMSLFARNPKKFQPSLHIEGKALNRKLPEFFALFKDLILHSEFRDTRRLKEVIDKLHTGLEQSLSSDPLKYASNLSASYHSPSSQLASYWSGLDYFWFIRDLVQNWEQKCDGLIHHLEELQRSVLFTENSHLTVTTDQKSYEAMKKERFYGLLEHQASPIEPWSSKWERRSPEHTGFTIASEVAFTSQSLPGVPYTDPASAPLALAARLCNNCVLHKEIREKGGAYGGGASANPLGGSFNFFAYRDPNLAASIEAFEKAAQSIVELKFSDRHVKEAKLEMIQKLDSPPSPGQKGEIAAGWRKSGLDSETRQAFRHRILKCNAQDISSAVERYLLPLFAQSAVVSFSGKSFFEKENSLLKKLGREELVLKKP